MGAASSNHKHVAGRLIASPLDLTTLPNLQGTQLGTIQRLAFRPVPRIDVITAQEFGSEAVDGVLLGHDLLLEGIFYGWDEEQVAAVLYGGALSGVSSTPLVTYPSASQGALIEESGKTQTLIWVPNDETANPASIYRRAVPWMVSKPIYSAGRQPMVIHASWLLLRDASGRRYSSGLLSELSL